MAQKKPVRENLAQNSGKTSRTKKKNALTQEKLPDSRNQIPDKEAQKSSQKRFVLLRILFAIGRFFRGIWRKISRRERNFLARRPHRSFYLTKKSEARRPWRIRSYISFQGEVFSLILRNRGVLLRFFLLYVLLLVIFGALLNQENFASLRDSLDQIGSEGLARFTALFSSAITNASGSFQKNTLAVLVFLYGWLSLIWLFRHFSNGEKVRLRDGIYSGGAPVVALAVILLVMLVQLLPFALGLVAYSSVTAAGWINSGIQIENMAAWCALAALAVMTLFWMTGSFIAMIVVALPGVYPFQALRVAGDMVTSRRLRIVFRLIFMMLPVALIWIVFLGGAIILDGTLKISWLPLVPIIIALLSSATLIWCAGYIYLMYRRLLDDPTPPAKIREKRKKRLKKKAKQKNSPKDAKIKA